jgi:hypothetical protein
LRKRVLQGEQRWLRESGLNPVTVRRPTGVGEEDLEQRSAEQRIEMRAHLSSASRNTGCDSYKVRPMPAYW